MAERLGADRRNQHARGFQGSPLIMTPNAYDVAWQTFELLLPEMLLVLSATAMMTLGAFLRLPRRAWCATAVVTMGVALITLLGVGSQAVDAYSAVATGDEFASYGRLIFLLTGLLVLGLAHDQVDDGRAAEFFGSLLLINAGAMLVAASNELVFLFVGLELVSIPTYLLLYLPRRDKNTLEAATKYFFLSIFSSGLLLFGLAYVYGLTGVTNLKALGYLSGHMSGVPQHQLALIALVFVLAGLGFRVAAVPFHFYAPDVYQGSPTVLTAMLAWVPKAVGFLAMLRVFTALIPVSTTPSALTHQAVLLAWIVAVVTMTLGNTVALAQVNLKRLLAYSSIAHAGYLMIGIAVTFAGGAGAGSLYYGAEAVLFYLTAYALMTLGAFGVILLLSTEERAVETVEDLAGLGRTHPASAFALAICLFSLAGIPPLAGFWGKFELFAAAFSASSGPDGRLLWWLAVIGVLNSAAGVYYYLKIVVAMYLRSPTSEALHPRFAWPTALVVITCAGLSLILGLFPTPVIQSTHEAAVAIFLHPDLLTNPQPVTPVPDPTAALPAPLRSPSR
jgi:NADH-quinone oxidoreductase subunit N